MRQPSQHASPDRPWYVVRLDGWRFPVWWTGNCWNTDKGNAKRYRAQGAASVMRMLRPHETVREPS